ncbi:hypothetical protein Nepgr_013039 [Nepenthes gracilis]|uniref:Uncharacterized protein n=1 Tax=Nepenthes gracilis TaxID=150966 RepID=A0AAD3SH19_NEPGR|nr:hypothetical protein Nepgr_013039 [Nepenthes gracilis]
MNVVVYDFGSVHSMVELGLGLGVVWLDKVGIGVLEVVVVSRDVGSSSGCGSGAGCDGFVGVGCCFDWCCLLEKAVLVEMDMPADAQKNFAEWRDCGGGDRVGNWWWEVVWLVIVCGKVLLGQKD